MSQIFLTLYREFLYRPFFNALVYLTALIPGHDIGIAIVILTILVRVLLFPLTHRSLLTQIKMKALEPEINRIKAETKNKSDEGAKKIMELYREHGVSPLMGCLTLFIQLPILIALYQVFWHGISLSGTEFYSFVSLPSFVNSMFLGLIDMGKPSLILAFLAAASQFLQMKLAFPEIPKRGEGFKEEMSRAMAIQSKFVFPLIIFYISTRFPAALALYWTVTNVFATVHESLVRMRARSLTK